MRRQHLRPPGPDDAERAEARVRAWRAAPPSGAAESHPCEQRPGGWVPDEDWRQGDNDQPPAGPPSGSRPAGSPAEAVPAGVGWVHGRWGWLVDRLPTALRGASVAPSRRAVSAMAVVALAVAASTGWLLLRNAPQPAVVAPAVARTLPVGTASPSPVRVVLVDVAGKVRRPGVVRLPLGSRVGDAVRAAGGVPAGVDVGLLNLARPLTDGEQVLVGLGAVEAAPVSPGASGGAGSAGGSPVELNTATLADLDGLPGVGPVLAQRIVEWRTAHGPFTSVEQLRDVPGIGDRKFEDLRPRVRV